jgi:integrase
VTKTTKSRRMIVVSAFAIEAINGHLEAMRTERATGPSDLVFCDTQGGPLRRHFRPIMEKAGLPDDIRPYDLRHSLATILLVEGESPKLGAERLDDSTIRQTICTCSHVIKGMQEQVADKLESLFRDQKFETATGQKKPERNGDG